MSFEVGEDFHLFSIVQFLHFPPAGADLQSAPFNFGSVIRYPS